MPHMYVNRPRYYAFASELSDLEAHFHWETVNAVLYGFGGVVFIAGSILFFPELGAYTDDGAWTFFFGSLVYLVVTGHDMVEAIRYRLTLARPTLVAEMELVAAAAYLVGTVLFTVGSVFFLSRVGWETAGAWCFVIGSLLFVFGACINVLQIIQERSLVTLQLMNLTAVSFVVGSVLFTVASVPYLWSVAPGGREILYSFLAWQYVIGSGLFLLGGVFNYWRAYLVVTGEIAAR
jgi:predicted membrane channel-forming protein YqfA (hemolysin III family)